MIGLKGAKKLQQQLKEVSARIKTGNVNDFRMAQNYKLIFKEINFIDSVILNNVKYMRNNDMLLSFLDNIYKALLDMGITQIKGNVQTINVQEELNEVREERDNYTKDKELSDKHRKYFNDYIKPKIKDE